MLELQAGAKLYHAWSTVAQAGISLRHIGNLRDDAHRQRVARSIASESQRPIGQSKVRVIEDVEELGAKLQLEAVMETRRLNWHAARLDLPGEFQGCFTRKRE